MIRGCAGRVDDRDVEVGFREIGTGEIGTGEIGTGEIGTGEIGTGASTLVLCDQLTKANSDSPTGTSS